MTEHSRCAPARTTRQMRSSPKLAGSFYDGLSAKGQHSLACLREVIRTVGFYAKKERRTERTLLVYPSRRRVYPVLNPRFARPTQDVEPTSQQPSVVIAVLSDDDGRIPGLLSDLPEPRLCPFVPERNAEDAIDLRPGTYRLHGHFLVEIPFLGSYRAQQVEYAALDPALSESHRHVSVHYSLQRSEAR